MKRLILSYATILSVFITIIGCGGGHTIVMTAPSTQWPVSSVTLMPMPSSVEVPEEIQSAFESKLITHLYDTDIFRKGTELTLQYRFVEFTPGNQFVRWLVWPVGAGEGSLKVEVRYVDASERELTRIQSSGNVRNGNSIEFALDRAAEEIAEYTKKHFH